MTQPTDKDKTDTTASNEKNAPSVDGTTNNVPKSAEAAIEKVSVDTSPVSEESKTSATSESSSQPPISAHRNRKSQRKINKPNRTESKPEEIKRATVWPWILLNLILLMAIGAAGYFAWQEWNGFKQAQNEQYETALASLNATTADIKGELIAKLGADLQQLRTDNAQQDKALQQQRLAIAKNAGRNQLQWTLSEARFLARMAGRKIWLENDLKTAVSLLKSADQVIAEANAPELLPIRSAFAADIAALKALDQIDLSSYAMTLSALQRTVDKLTFAEPEAYYEAPEEEVSADIGQWRRNLGIIWKSIKDNFINIERVDTPIAPFVSQKLQILKKADLSLHLSIAQEALLKKDQQYFQSTVENAQSLLSFFDASDTNVMTTKAQLAELSSITITQPPPSELTSLMLLREALSDNDGLDTSKDFAND